MALVIADLHISDRPFEDYRVKFLQRLPDLAAVLNESSIFILGDLTQTKDKHSAQLVNQVVDLMAALAEDCEIIILKGNHDYAESRDPYFRFLSHIKDIRFIQQPAFMEGSLFLPHTRDYKRDWRKVRFDGVKQIFTHNTFQGARGESGKELDGIPLDALPCIPIYSGDVHVPQLLKNVTYVGAPYTINFGDKFKPRALRIWEGIHAKSVPLDGPQKRLVRVRQDGAVQLNGAEHGDIVRIELEMLQEDYAEWSLLRERCEAFCTDSGFVLEKIIPVLTDMQPYRDERAAQRMGFTTRSDEEILRAYCKRKNLDEATRKVGLELL